MIRKTLSFFTFSVLSIFSTQAQLTYDYYGDGRSPIDEIEDTVLAHQLPKADSYFFIRNIGKKPQLDLSDSTQTTAEWRELAEWYYNMRDYTHAGRPTPTSSTLIEPRTRTFTTMFSLSKRWVVMKTYVPT